jgi:hypothetical protein
MTHAATVAGQTRIGRRLLWAIVIVSGHFRVVAGMVMNRCRVLILIAKRHGKRVQILQGQSGDQHQ